MNIIETPWIPTDIGVVKPLDALTKARHILWPRADWNAASFCLLHAIVQTAVVLEPSRCKDRSDWERMLSHPQPKDIASWFNLDLGSSPWQCQNAEGAIPVAQILPDSPGANTIKQAKDITRWIEDVPKSLTLPETTIAIISDNLWGTGIGRGHRQGARGKQALMTVIEPEKEGALLWERIWLNILPEDSWCAKFMREGDSIPFEFPWKEPLPKNGEELTPLNVHSLGILWQMPRRYRVIQDDDGLVRRVHRQAGGRHYTGWGKRHPLTPSCFCKNDGTWVSKKIRAHKIRAHVGFSDWAALAINFLEKTKPSAVISTLVEDGYQQENPQRLRCFGWGLTDSDDAGIWLDDAVPFYVKLKPEASLVEEAIQDAEKQKKRLSWALQGLRNSPGNSAKKIARRMQRIIHRMEKSFYDRLPDNRFGDEWKKELKKEARSIFWQAVEDHRINLVEAMKALRQL